MAELESSRISLLPHILPPVPSLSPLEHARAQALASFLQAHNLYGDAGCDPGRDLCLPEFTPQAQTAILSTAATTPLIPPVDGPILISFPESNQGSTPTYGITYLAPSGAVIFAPFAGQIRLVQNLTAGRIQISIEHEGSDGQLKLSVLTGQFETALKAEDHVVTGQPLGRARPLRDGSTRILYNLIIGDTRVDPVPWFNNGFNNGF